MPYGGELLYPVVILQRERNGLFVAIGGPIATMILLIYCYIHSHFLGEEYSFEFNSHYYLNLLPIVPLDGGQVLVHYLKEKG